MREWTQVVSMINGDFQFAVAQAYRMFQKQPDVVLQM